jgi:hypothetical protein
MFLKRLVFFPWDDNHLPFALPKGRRALIAPDISNRFNGDWKVRVHTELDMEQTKRSSRPTQKYTG